MKNEANFGVKWHVLIVKSRSEKRVGQRLGEMGFEACVPTQMQVRQWSDRKKMVEMVLFNKYVFVATDTLRRNEVFQIGHIIKYLQFSNKMATLTAEEVTFIKRLSGLQNPVEITYDHFKVNDWVEIISGPMCGYKGRVLSQGGPARIRLSLPGLQCFAHVELKSEEILKINPENYNSGLEFPGSH